MTIWSRDALMDLAVHPETIPKLLHLAHSAAQEQPGSPDLANFAPAFQRARDNLAPGVEYIVPDTTAKLLFNRDRLLEEIGKAERAIAEAMIEKK